MLFFQQSPKKAASKNITLEKEDSGSMSCVHCKKSFTNKKSYLKHLALHKHKKQAQHTCEFCQKLFKKPSDLVN